MTTLTIPSADAAVLGAGQCQFYGTISGGGATVALEGTGHGIGTTASTTIICQLRQGTKVVMDSRLAVPGALAATAKTGTIPLAPTKVCVRVIVRDILTTADTDSGFWCDDEVVALAGVAVTA